MFPTKRTNGERFSCLDFFQTAEWLDRRLVLSQEYSFRGTMNFVF
jgi:hypothetical protein